MSLAPLMLRYCATLPAADSKCRRGLCFQGVFSGGGSVSLGTARQNPHPKTHIPRSHESTSSAWRPAAAGTELLRSRKNAFAPVLGGGRFTQPGADGGEC